MTIETFLRELLAREPLSRYCFFYWHYKYSPTKVLDINIQNDASRFILRYENRYMIKGEDHFSELAKEIRWFPYNIVIQFDQDVNWEKISNNFSNYRSVITGKNVDSYQTFLMMKCTNKSLTPSVGYRKEVRLIRRQSINLYVLPKNIRRTLAKSDGAVVAWVKDKVLYGYATAPYICVNERKFAIIRSVITKKEFQGRGVASQTVWSLCKYLFSEGIKDIFLWVHNENHLAVNLYKKLGFVIDGEINQIFCDVKEKKLINRI